PALDCLAREWPKGNEEQRPVLLRKWLDRAETLAGKAEYDRAQRALDELLHLDPGNQRALALSKRVRQDRSAALIELLLEDGRLESLRGAARKLLSPDGKDLPEVIRQRLGQRLER